MFLVGNEYLWCIKKMDSSHNKRIDYEFTGCKELL